MKYVRKIKYMAKVIKDQTGKEVGEAVAIRNYFGMKPDQTTAGFMAEVRELTPEAKTELALGAAKELGYTVE